MMRISLGYPSQADEIAILNSQQTHHPIEDIEQVITADELVAAQKTVKEVYMDDLIKEYIVLLTNATRKHPDVYLGASPRGSLALYKTARARAAIESRNFVIPDDIKALADFTLSHRIIISPSARIKNVDARAIMGEVLDSVPIPGTRVKAR